MEGGAVTADARVAQAPGVPVLGETSGTPSLAGSQRLNDRLDRIRFEEAAKAEHGSHTARALANIYLRTQRFRELSPSRAYRNKRDVMIFADWVERCRGNRDFPQLMKPDFEAFLALYDDRKSLQLDLRSVLNILCNEAIDAGWRPDNPVRRLSWKAPPPKEEVVLWKDDMPRIFAEMARRMGQPGLAALIEVGVLTGQRLIDLRLAKHGANFHGGRLRLKQTKTRAKVNVALPRPICELIEAVRLEGSPFLFNDADTGTGFTVGRLHARFSEVRCAVTPEKGPKMLLRTMRHSAVCRMVDAGVHLRKINAVTGHKLGRVHKIVERYAIDTEGFADAAMMELHRANGGSDEDFDATDFGADRDWDADNVQKAIYRTPPVDPDRPERFLAAKLGQHRHRYVMPRELVEAWPEEDGAATA
jgi:hypothetical protein